MLDAQSALFQTQNDLTASEAALSTDLVVLYKALGGGWAAGPTLADAAGLPADGGGAPLP